jgi:hypothetical protein
MCKGIRFDRVKTLEKLNMRIMLLLFGLLLLPLPANAVRITQSDPHLNILNHEES